MLDTNIISYIIREQNLTLIDKFKQISEKDNSIAVSSITVAELFYGVKKKNSKKLEIAITKFLFPLKKFPFDEKAALTYGDIRAKLEAKGKIIGAYDMLIAAHAKSIGAILVTNNEKEFKRVEGLKIENWI
ncbi:type II toxin-antitoxin system tRNA(fMet)-specific endonuclease VapC [Hydrogenothermus marinus]|nr:type II toxin-antitoxin system VapC family toxin [Hydrogenothermus marinus]